MVTYIYVDARWVQALRQNSAINSEIQLELVAV